MTRKPNIQDKFKDMWDEHGPTGVGELSKEHRFCEGRQWRFDFALLDYRIAIELEGGVFHRGGHTRGKVYTDNCEKYNRAAILGWIVLRFTVKDFDAASQLRVIEDIEDAIELRNKQHSLDRCVPNPIIVSETF